jgi:hypothetical protein
MIVHKRLYIILIRELSFSLRFHIVITFL